MGQGTQTIGFVGTRISVQAVDEDDSSLDLRGHKALSVRSMVDVVDQSQIVLVAILNLPGEERWSVLRYIAVRYCELIPESDLSARYSGQGGIDDIAHVLLCSREAEEGSA